jgi:proteasome assembly chaperone (PAC2) family protein
MPGLMDFLEPFATGYLETKITGQEKRAEAIQKANELADAKLAEIAKNRAIQLDNLEIENADLEEKRAKEEEQVLKHHEDMNPVVLVSK